MLVGNCKIYGIRVVMCWTAVIHDLGCFLGVEKFGSFCEVSLRDKFLYWDVYNICGILVSVSNMSPCIEAGLTWISHPPASISESDTERFNHSVQVKRRIMVCLLEYWNLASLF